MSSVPPLAATAQTSEARDCLELRLANGWTRAEFRQCKLEESRTRTAQLDAEFAQMRDWLRVRGLDVNDAGHITDPQGRTLAQIEATNADLVAGNAALRAEIGSLRLSIQTSRAEYLQILQEFERTVLQNQ